MSRAEHAETRTLVTAARLTVGARVRTADPLTGSFGGMWAAHRKAGATGVVKYAYRNVRSRYEVRHDDGTEAPYDIDELAVLDPVTP